MFQFGWVAFLMLIALVPAYIAHGKGRSLFLWWLYGVVLWIIALPHALLISDETQKPVGLKPRPRPQPSPNDMSEAGIAARIAAEDLRRFQEQSKQ